MKRLTDSLYAVAAFAFTLAVVCTGLCLAAFNRASLYDTGVVS